MTHAWIGHGYGFYPEDILPCLAVLCFLATVPLSIVALVLAVRSSRRVRAMQRRLDAAREVRAPAGVSPAAPAAGSEAPSPPAAREVRAPAGVSPAAPAAGSGMPPPPVLRAAVAERPPRKPVRWEALIGLKGLAGAGVVAVLLGVVFLIYHAWQQGWFGHGMMRVVIPMAAGLVLLAGGEWFSLKDFRALARTTTGGGLAMLYLAAFLACVEVNERVVIPEPAAWPVAWTLVAVITAVAILLSVRYASLTVAVFSLVGGLAGPALIGLLLKPRDPGHVLFLYMLGMGLGLLVLAYYRKWRVLNLLVLVGVIANFAVWLGRHYWYTTPWATEKLGFAVTYLTIFWFLFFLVSVVYHMPARRDSAGGPERRAPSRLDLPVTIINLVWYFAVLYALLREPEAHHLWLGPVAAVLGAVYLGHGLAMRRWAPVHMRLILLQLAQALGMFTLAIPIALEGIWIPMAWGAEAAVLCFLGVRLKDWRIRAVGLMVHAASVVALFWFLDDAWHAKGPLVLNARTATVGVVALAMAVSALLYRRVEKKSLAERGLVGAAATLAHGLLIFLVLLEIAWWHEKVALAKWKDAAVVPEGTYERLAWLRHMASVIALGAYALAAAGAGVVLRRALHHAMALAAVAVVVVLLLGGPAYGLPALEGLAALNEVGAMFAAVAACLALAALATRYGAGEVRWRRGFAITYELLALGIVLWLYGAEVWRGTEYAVEELGVTVSPRSFASLLAAGFAAYAGGLLLRGVQVRSLPHRVSGLACAAVALLVLLASAGADEGPYKTVLWNPRGVAWALALVSLAAGAAAYRRLPRPSAEARVLAPLLSVILHVGVLVLFTLEAGDFWDLRAERWFPEQERHAFYARQATLSVGYALYGVGLLAAGIARRRTLLRVLALAILGGTVLKTIAYDMSQVRAIWRVLSFIGLGVLLMAGSLLYHKYRHVLFGPQEPPGPRQGLRPGRGPPAAEKETSHGAS